MTNHWIDIRNADCVLIIGSNAAENHPISFKYVLEARDAGAKVIHVDPRYTRTSSKANIYLRIRSGTDIAFMGGLILYVLEDLRKNPQNYNIDYISQYTNAAYIVKDGVKLPGETGQDGLFSGWDGSKYDPATWKYEDMTNATAEAKLLTAHWLGWTNRANPFAEVAWGELHDRCVLRLLYENYKRYDLETVSRITGASPEELQAVYAEFARTGAKGKAGTIMYAMGTTQHTYGTQNIRSYSIAQLLLANMGVCGGGINALRGTSNVQGSTDFALLYHILPGYLKVPNDSDGDQTLAGYLARITPATTNPPTEMEGGASVNWWKNTPKYVVSLLKAWWPTVDKETSYHYLPKGKATTNYSHVAMIEAMGAGKIDGLWVWGQNPAAGGPNSNGAREALGNLKWLVLADIWMNETAEFWKRPGVDSSAIDTEVFLLPAAASYEKEGSIANSGRWAQWRYKAVEPPGEEATRGKPDLEIISLLVLKLKDLYEAEGGPGKDAILDLAWDYEHPEHPSADEVAKEINGKALEAFTDGTRTYAAGELIDTFVQLRDDGKTACGNWIYCNQYTVADGNKLKRRDNVDTSGVGLYSNWTWCWPVNRRIIYNRASVDLDGKPWDKSHPVVTWNGTAWVGDVIDGGGGPVKGGGNLPFIMLPEGAGRLWGYGLKDGPIPEVYEPWESPIQNVMSAQQVNPAAYIGTFRNEKGDPEDYPYIGTTYRCTEHWQTGIMTRNLPWLGELMPNMYAEIGEDLADVLGITAGDKVIVSSARGEIEAVAVVTRRLARLKVDGKVVHHVGVLWHWGYSGLFKGDSGNVLTPHIGDANTTIPEYKSFLCSVRRA